MTNNIKQIKDLKKSETPNISKNGFLPQSINKENESFWDMLHLNICPQLTILSFSVVFVIIITLFFAAQLKIDGFSKETSRVQKEFLPINHSGPLTESLSSNHKKIKNDFQIYRFFTSLFIHSNFWHFLSNSLMIIIWTSYFEIFLTTLYTPLLFFLSGIIGNVFAVLIDGPLITSFGASTGIFGIIGCAIGFIAFNWANLAYKGSPRFFWSIQIFFIAIMSFVLTSAGISNNAHVGGFLAGIGVGCFLSPRHFRDGEERKSFTGHELGVKAVGVLWTFGMFCVCFSLLIFN